MRKNIAILTMSLNIGGAETHIFELACALAARGNNVTVFSAGGVYADKLEEHGIEHIKAPLDSKSPGSLLRSYRIVSKYVKNNRPCVIHSHTRISNFTANAVARRYCVPFVSTVHFNFKTGLFQKLFTRWGDRALSVSEDLREYAAREYGFEREKIKVTVNGINLTTFSKKPLPEFRRTLGLAPDSKVILCVSRLDEVAGDHVLRVLNMAKSIYADTPDANIVIVGSGTRFKEFSEIASQVNSVTKENFIRMAGAQTDIYKYCNIADLFIGISRSALEAMACRVPVILLGNSGYLGLYSKATHDACIDTNFTCRGCPYPDEQEILSLIKNILGNPDSYAEYVENAYETVKTRYSVVRMAQDAEEVYAAAQKDLRPVDFMLCGYYGRHNLGDDMSLKAFADNMTSVCNADSIVLLSADPADTHTEHITRVVHRFNLPVIYSIMKKTNVFALGGGSILQDATSSRSLFYYTHIAYMAKKYGCKVMLYSNGVGPIEKKNNIARSVRLLNSADLITVRDRRSLVYMHSLGVTNTNIKLTADETFTLDRQNITTPYKGLGSEKYLCVNLRNSDISESFLDNFAAFTDSVCRKYGFTAVLLPIHYDKDIAVLSEISGKLKCQHILINENLPHSQTLDILIKCELSVMERLHGIIFSCILGKPFLAINYDPKVLSFCIEIGMEDYVIDLASFSSDKVERQFDTLMENRDSVSDMLKEKADRKRESALGNSKSACELLKKR